MSEYISLRQRNADGKHLDKIWEGYAEFVGIRDGEGCIYLDPHINFHATLGDIRRVGRWIEWHGQLYRVMRWGYRQGEQTVDVLSDWVAAERYAV